MFSTMLVNTIRPEFATIGLRSIAVPNVSCSGGPLTRLVEGEMWIRQMFDFSVSLLANITALFRRLQVLGIGNAARSPAARSA